MDLNLETKFIKGTNEQYSIRNDGVVIRHFSYVTNQFMKKIVYRDVIIKKKLVDRKINPENKLPYVRVLLYPIEGKKRECIIKVLVIKYFTDIVINTNTRITHKDNNVFNCSLDNLSVERKLSNYLNVNRPLTRVEIATKNKRDLTKAYVGNQIGIHAKNIPEEVYEEYKALLKIKRLLAQKLNINIKSLQ
jgi:hypothetical protein